MDRFSSFLGRLFIRKPQITPKEENRQILENAICDALLIVMSAAQNAIILDEQVVTTIVTAKDAVEKRTIDTALESEFWSAYEQAAKSIRPVTIDSIKATYDPNPSHRSFITRLFVREKVPLSRKCASNYKLLSLVTLLFLITIQIYWYIGASLTADINTQSHTVSSLNDALTALEIQETRNSTSGRETRSKIVKLQQQIDEHTAWKDAASNHLTNWNEVWSSMDLLTLQPWQVPDYQTFTLEVQRRIQFVAAKNSLEAITSYILPILYGLIGACFYILRQLPKEIEALTFSMNSYIDYSLRMAQGPLAGIMVSYFLSSPDDKPIAHYVSGAAVMPVDGSISKLSPLAAAFLAGYSVEFIFRFIDKFLNSSIADKKEDISHTFDKKSPRRKKDRNLEKTKSQSNGPETSP